MARPGRVLIGETELRGRIAELGADLARDYARESPIVVGVLQGAFLFMADLVRATPIDLTTDFIGVASYAGARSSGHVRIVSDLSMSIEGRDVLVVDPRSLRVCVLVDKIERRKVDVALDYVGFTIPNVFVVGYGFDYEGLYRNLPHVAALEGE